MQEDQERIALTFKDILAFAKKVDEDLMPSISNPDEVVMWIDKNKLNSSKTLANKTFLGIEDIRIPCSKEFAEACLNLREDKYKPPRSYFPIGGLNIGVGTNGRGNPYIRINSSDSGDFQKLRDSRFVEDFYKADEMKNRHIDAINDALCRSIELIFDSNKIV